MFELDEKFFEEIGVNAMPAQEREAFKAHIQQEIETRVAERIADGMTMEKLNEFEAIIDGNINVTHEWILQYAPDYKNDIVYQTFVEQNGHESAELICEYAALKWLQLNRPDFEQIVATVMSDMKNELRANISKITA